MGASAGFWFLLRRTVDHREEIWCADSEKAANQEAHRHAHERADIAITEPLTPIKAAPAEANEKAYAAAYEAAHAAVVPAEYTEYNHACERREGEQ
jgi:hypothetical protein